MHREITNTAQENQMRTGEGFVAALDQSGGSTPKALRLYGIQDDQYSDEIEMFDLVHQMRERIMTSTQFSGDRIIAAILFEQTMNRQVAGKDTPFYLWEDKGIVPILKVDKGLLDESHGVRLMKPIDNLDELLEHAHTKGIFGTKARSVIAAADPGGIAENLAQQFEYGNRILEHGLVPILEPEVDITSPDKGKIEDILEPELRSHLDALPQDRSVMLKLTIPDKDNHYADLIAHPRVMRVVALSGGYTREEANRRLARNHGLIASFSRALTQGLTVQQSEDDFNRMLSESVDSIFRASIT
ncbi:fructose bisphosphate aldolase [Tessaracoccus antarcticus]|uniref:fructose-bisphosphate aldolase n=1 Tax=Tessaracoccus antarcticus TaxID=2479848 RepID=A0A3M0GC01_9ACTN|nr:fructose bisphosphate aldolase [Tessaracoccus antarcticus]RMB60112.1 fructose bisphosphate aldolase [Tessaracoccus antarcticus]